MSIHSYFMSGSRLKKAQQLTFDARQEEGEKANILFQQAYDSYASVSESFSRYSDTLHYWGLAHLQQAETKSFSAEAIKIYEEAINKFSLCKAIAPNHLGAVIDEGVALLGLAKCKQVSFDDELYSNANALFEVAETIQSGSASYNLACIYALQHKSEACLKALENARDHGLIPDEDNIINDVDLQNIKKMPWFTDYIKSFEEDKKEDDVEVEEKVNDAELSE